MAFQQGEHAHGVGLAGAVGEGGDGGFDGVHAGIDGGEVGGGTEAGGVVGVKGDGNADLALELLDEIVGDLRRHDAGHVLDADGVAAHFLQLDAHLDEGLDGVDRAGGVADFAAGVLATFEHRLDAGDEVAGVVERVENAEHVLSGIGIGADEGLHDVVRETGVLHDVLAAQQHDLRRLGRGFLQGAEAVERILAQIAQARVDGGTAPGFKAAEAHLVEDGGGGQHLRGGHAGGGQGLVAVAQDGVVECDGDHDVEEARLEVVGVVSCWKPPENVASGRVHG